MSRYIDANKIIICASEGISKDGLIFIPMRDVHKSIDNTPTADVVEVRHGEWTKHSAYYECSVCKEDFFVEGYAEDYDPISDWDLHFCPNCGAKMDGERKEG